MTGDDLEGLGSIAVILFIIANVYYPARWIVRTNDLNVDLRKFFKNYMQIHVPLNAIGILLAIYHAHFADENNMLLQLSSLLMLGLAANGAIMYYYLPKGDQRRRQLIQLEQVLFAVWIGAVFIGHAIL